MMDCTSVGGTILELARMRLRHLGRDMSETVFRPSTPIPQALGLQHKRAPWRGCYPRVGPERPKASSREERERREGACNARGRIGTFLLES